MKYALIAMALGAVLLLSGCALWQRMDAAEDYVEDRLEAQLRPSPDPHGLPEEEAAEIALSHAGLTREQAEYLYTEYDVDDGVPLYEVHFRVGPREYEYEVHGETGEILSYDVDG